MPKKPSPQSPPRPKRPKPTNISGIIQPPKQPNALNARIQRELEQMQGTIRAFKRAAYALTGILVVIGLVLAAVFLYHHSARHPAAAPDPVPLNVRNSVDFTVYYPDQAKLPAGYTLDTGSISASQEAVIMVVDYGGGRVVLSEQAKLSDADLQAFYSHHLPLHNDLQTNVGTAAIGALNNQTFASLPTSGNTWIITTAPLNTNQAGFKKVLQALSP